MSVRVTKLYDRRVTDKTADTIRRRTKCDAKSYSDRGYAARRRLAKSTRPLRMLGQ